MTKRSHSDGWFCYTSLAASYPCLPRLAASCCFTKLQFCLVDDSWFPRIRLRKTWSGHHDIRVLFPINYRKPTVSIGCFLLYFNDLPQFLSGAPQVVYTSSPYVMPGAASVSAMPMTSYTTMPMAYSTSESQIKDKEIRRHRMMLMDITLRQLQKR